MDRLRHAVAVASGGGGWGGGVVGGVGSVALGVLALATSFVDVMRCVGVETE